MDAIGSHISEFWRVGREADPLYVPVQFQGGPSGGRFDDADREFGVVYGAPDPATCMLEKLRSTSYPAAGEPYSKEPVIDDEHLTDLEARELEIARRPRRVRPDIYECVLVHATVTTPLALLAILQTRVLETLGSHPRIARLLATASRPHLTIGDLLGAGVEIPQTATAILMREVVLGRRWEGIQVLSTHGPRTSYAIFADRLRARSATILIKRITRDDVTLQATARELGLEL